MQKSGAETYSDLISLFALEVHNIRPPDPAKNYEGVSAVIAGWGAFNFNDKSSDILQEARVNTISNLECNNSNWVKEAIETKILDSKICAETPGVDSRIGGDL